MWVGAEAGLRGTRVEIAAVRTEAAAPVGAATLTSIVAAPLLNGTVAAIEPAAPAGPELAKPASGGCRSVSRRDCSSETADFDQKSVKAGNPGWVWRFEGGRGAENLAPALKLIFCYRRWSLWL